MRHRYGLGPLAPGEYGFIVNLGGRDVAKRGFSVPEPVTPGPLATLTAPPLETATADPYSFQILFNAAAGWKGDPGQGQVTVAGPDGFTGVAKLVSSIPSLDPIGRLYSCSYALTGPGGAWDAADSGYYRVCVDLAAVVDRQGRTLPRPCVGVFPVRIRPEPPPPPPGRQATVTVEMRDGRWFANVAFENTGGWFACDWGTPRVHGNVFAAAAALKPLQVGVEVSRDLLTWTDGSDLVDWIPADPDPDGTQAVEVVQKPELDGAGWPFMRLRVAETASP